jgi:hypothetical protein
MAEFTSNTQKEVSKFAPFSLTPDMGAKFEHVAIAALEVVKLPFMPYVEFVFNGKKIRVEKHSTFEELELEFFEKGGQSNG